MTTQGEIAEIMPIRQQTDPAQPPVKISANKCTKYLDYQGDWLEKTLGNLMIVATVIASMAFQAAMNPPSQLWKNDYSQQKECKAGMIKDAFKNKRIIEARNLAINCIEKFSSQEFIICNTVSFSASLSIIFLLTVLPLRNRFSMWILLVAICITVIFVAATYIISISLVEGVGSNQERFNNGILLYYIVFWVGLLVVIVVSFTLNLLFWLLKNLVIGVGKLLQKLKGIKSPAVRV